MTSLEKHAREWEHFADNDPTCNEHLAKTCRDAATSLRLEEKTGVAHCACHLIPIEDCRKRARK